MYNLSSLSLLTLVILGVVEQSYSFRPAAFGRSSFFLAAKNSATEISPVASKAADATSIVSDPSVKLNACCDEDFCFAEPPATETGADSLPMINLENVHILTSFFGTYP